MPWISKKAARQCHQLIHVFVRPIASVYPLIFCSLYENFGIGKQGDVADVVPVSVGNSDISNIGRLETDLCKLTCYCLVQVIDDQLGQGRPAVRIADRRLWHSGVPK